MQIWLADDRESVRFGLHVLLEQQPGWRVLGESADAGHLLQQIKLTCPDIVLLDWDLPGLQVERLIAELKRICPKLQIIVSSARPEIERVAREAVAAAFIGKMSPPQKLIATMRSIDLSPSSIGEIKKDTVLDQDHE